MTLERGRELKNEHCFTSDSIFTKSNKSILCVKRLCKASMKKEKRSVVVKLSTITSKVIDGSWSWPAGKSGFCNHVMALLLGLAEYSLSQFKSALDKKMKFSIRDFFSKCDQIHRKLRIWSHLQKTSLMENFIFLCSAFTEEITGTSRLRQWGVPGETMQKGLVMETTV